MSQISAWRPRGRLLPIPVNRVGRPALGQAHAVSCSKPRHVGRAASAPVGAASQPPAATRPGWQTGRKEPAGRRMHKFEFNLSASLRCHSLADRLACFHSGLRTCFTTSGAGVKRCARVALRAAQRWAHMGSGSSAAPPLFGPPLGWSAQHGPPGAQIVPVAPN